MPLLPKLAQINSGFAVFSDRALPRLKSKEDAELSFYRREILQEMGSRLSSLAVQLQTLFR